MNSKKITLSVVLGVFLTVFTCKAFAIQEKQVPEAAVENKETSKFDPSATILEHIGDSHYFHVGGHIAFPLPVILYTDKGLEIFSSERFEEGEKAYQGKYYQYALIKDKVKAVVADGKTIDETATVIDLSITKNVASMWLSVLLLLIIFFSVASSYKKRVGKAPKGLQSLLEPVILFIRDDVALPNIGYKYHRFMPLLLTVFFFILINNLIGMVPFFPGGSNVTGNIAVTFVLAVVTLIVVNVNGNKYYWKHIFAPDVPFWLYPIMWVVELAGIISKPFALMVRLFANIMAGHVIVIALISLIFIFKTLGIAPVSIAFTLFIDVLELLVAFLQAFIFTMLMALFIGSAVEEHHH
ncbi:F0F1 ATP synthase subunit A [Mucilaginibacter sp. FT3.2]|uniref:F0F1 ATP synthase subunit A n=1 Tax=Mucilaginibacter sp. FT3.2 TaxID=2723090 RepID=UPI00181F40D0|nr:F-type H+-transporting ATPase subunit a [Mucilaginibacter sp. FT3.2]